MLYSNSSGKTKGKPDRPSLFLLIMIYLSFSKPFGRAEDNPLPLYFSEHLQSRSDRILKNERGEKCDLHPV